MKRRMRVAHVVIALEYGGLEQLVVRWTNERNKTYDESCTHVFCLDSIGPLAECIKHDVVSCVEAKRSSFPWDRHAVSKLERLVKTYDIDILHSHNLTAMQYAALASILKPVKHIYTQHGANTHLLSIKDILRGKILSYAANSMVAVSQSTAMSMNKQQWFPLGKISVIPNGVEILPFHNREQVSLLKRQHEIPGNTTIFGSVGRLAPVKGWDRFLPVFKKFIEFGDNSVILLLVGDGSEREQIEILANKFEIQDNIIMAGMQSDVRPYLEMMDFFLLPSRSEGLSLALLEAMAASKPVIVTDVGENRTVVDNGKTGFILPQDESLWVDVLLEILKNKISYKTIGDLARQRVINNYTMGATLQAYEGLYLK